MTVTVRVTWRGPEITRQFTQAAKRGVFKAANIHRNEMLRLVQRTPKTGRIYTRGSVQHQASAPGESPASDRGRLVQSMRVEMASAGIKATSLVGTNYARRLEMEMDRPFVLRAFQNVKQQMIAAVTDEIARSMKKGQA